MSVVPSFTQVGTQFADFDTAGAIRIHTAGSGVLLGADGSGRPVTISLFRPEPTFAVVVGRVGLAQIVGFRALALGAALAVSTVRPSAWSGLARTVSSIPGAVEITWPGSRPQWVGSSQRPQLLLIDSESTATVGAMPVVHAWSTLIAVREQLTSRDANMLGRADLILTQGLSPQEARLFSGVVNLSNYVQALTTLAPDAVAVVSHGNVRSARIAPTAIERQLIGPLFRG